MHTFNRNFLWAALSVLAAGATLAPRIVQAGVSVGVSITLAPPELPVYEQPFLPAPGYIWTPGYWAWGPEGYFWVPGTWIMPPRIGYLWTPGYWGWRNGFYIWSGGYWGPHVGFYGGVNYGYGYGGFGYDGGYWRGGQLYYNRAVNRFGGNVHITNVYERRVVNNVTVNRVSYHGGRGGIERSPTRAERDAERGPRLRGTEEQRAHVHGAENNRSFLASENHGRPPVGATPRAGAFDSGASRDRGSRGGERMDRPPSARGDRAQGDRGGRPPSTRERVERREQPAQGAESRDRGARRSEQGPGPASNGAERRGADHREPQTMRAPQSRGSEQRGPEQRGAGQPGASSDRGPKAREQNRTVERERR